MWTAKDPNETLDYNWPVPLDDGDSIASHTVTVTGANKDSDSVDGSRIVVWVSGGIAGQSATVAMTATTLGGRVFEFTGKIQIIDSADAFIVSFKAAFPSFADTPRETIAYWQDQAKLIADDRFGASQVHGLKLLTAHYLTLQGQGSGAEAQRIGKFGGATDVKSGTLSLSWTQSPNHSNSSYDQTSYGKEFGALVRAYLGGPRVTDTGVSPYYGYPYA